MKKTRFQFRTYYRKELAALYHCHPKTFNKWLQEMKDDIGPCKGWHLRPKQVRVIVEKLGKP